jgi:hypothetical protein
MSIEFLRNFLLVCGIINYGFLVLWALLMIWAHDSFYRFTTRWFRLSVEQFDGLQYGGIVFYKVAIFLFNLIPFVALLIVH